MNEPSETSSDSSHVIREFENAWRSELVTDFGKSVPKQAHTDTDLLLELACIDLENRLRVSDDTRVEFYTTLFPQLAADELVVLELIRTEFANRPDRDSLNAVYYGERFPKLAAQIEMMFQLELRGSGATHARDAKTNWTCAACDKPIDGNTKGQTACPHCKQPIAIGRYQLLERIGEGAFGYVFRAIDPKLEREVAVKVPRSQTILMPEETERFLRESRSAAQLDHSGIVRVFDTGRHNGVPYIVSELVDGQPLSEFAANTELDFRQATTIVLQIAKAVAHAHDRGIIHRDLKPSNVMCQTGSDGEPVTRVMDFGLARRDQADVSLTLEGQSLGTPAYMSPEQARGDLAAVSVRSDVYSMGVMLYQMVCGEVPFRGNVQMLIQQVIHDDPPSPSRFRSRIPRDLETACMKAISRDPNNRYATAHEFVADLERWINNEPIHARRVGPIGKTWRWCKRRPLIATLLLGLSTSITAGVVGVTYQWQRAEVALQNSEADLRDALESVDKVLSHLGSDTLEDVPQAKQLRADVLADALEFFQRFRKRNPDDPRVAMQVASAHSQVARILSALGRGDEAGKAYEAAVRDYERLEDTAPDHEDWMAAASTAHSRYGFFLVNRSKREQAVEQLRKCVSLRKQLLAADPSSSYRKARVASARADLGRMLKDQTKGEAEFDAAIKQLSKLTAKSDKIGYQRDLARILNNYSIYLTKAGKQGRAEDCRAQASVLYEAVIAADPNDESALAAYANCCRKQVEALRGESNLVAFEKYQQKAIDAYQRLTEDYPATPRHRDRFSSVLVEAAKYYRVQKRDDDAFATQERVVQQREILVSLFPGNTRYQRRLSGSLASLATKLSQVNRKTDAERRLRQRLTIRRKLAADKSPNDTVYAALAMKDLATLIKTSNSKKKKQEAVELQKEADELVAELSVEQVLWQDTSTTSKLTLLSSLTAVAKKENDLKGIEQAYRGKVEVLTQRLKTDSTNPKKQSDLARQWYVLGRFLRLNDREDEALDPYREAIRLDEQLLEADPQSARYLSQMVGHCSEFGQLLSKTDRVDEAIEVLDRSLEIARNLAEKHENVGFRNARFAFAYIQLADALTKRQGDEEQILIAYESAVELATAPVEKADFANVKPMAINSLAWFLLHCPDESLQDPERALELANQLIAIKQVTGRHYSTLAVAQFRNADYASAIASLQKSTELSPKLIALNTLITSMAQANLGDMETAAENYAEAVRLNAENSVEPELFEQYRQLADELLTRTGTAETDSEGP